MIHLIFKVLATCGIRKLLDFVFTQSELFWLDDILPGAKNKHVKMSDEENKTENNLSSNEQIYKRKDLNASKSVRS